VVGNRVIAFVDEVRDSTFDLLSHLVVADYTTGDRPVIVRKADIIWEVYFLVEQAISL
jgi:hypothetical protein